jgi:glutamine synthetase
MNQMSGKGSTARDAREATAFLESHPEVCAYHCFLTDLGGVARGKVLRPVELARAFSDGRPLPGSILGLDITGADVEETGLVWEDGDADRLCWPVAGTLVPQPWSPEPSAQFLLSSYEADGSGSPGDPRHALARVIDRFEPLGLTPVAAVELEFYVFDPSVIETGKPLPPRTAGGARPAQLQAYLMQDLEDFGPFIEALYRGGEAMGLPLRTLISEYAPGQLEIVLQHRADALRAAYEEIHNKLLNKSNERKKVNESSIITKTYAQN